MGFGRNVATVKSLQTKVTDRGELTSLVVSLPAYSKTGKISCRVYSGTAREGFTFHYLAAPKAKPDITKAVVMQRGYTKVIVELSNFPGTRRKEDIQVTTGGKKLKVTRIYYARTKSMKIQL